MPLADSLFFRDLAYVFLAAALGGAIARLARQPLILGYVLGGILVSPFTPGPSVTDVHTFELFAEIGVILLMFFIGAEFSVEELLRLKWVGVLGGTLGILLITGLGLGTAWLLGWSALQGMIVGIVISVASTLVLVRLLLDRGELHSRHGRVMIGITLFEDVAVVALIILMPALGALEPGRLLAVGLALGKAAAILVPIAYLAAKVFPRLLARVARARSQELFLLVALAISLGMAALTQWAGLSLALGAFLAGLIISGSDYAHEALARLLPLRDAFVALFFVTLGVLLDPRALLDNTPLVAAMVVLIVAGKLLVWTLVVRVFGYPLVTAVLVGVGLTQIGEFSFILARAAMAAGHVGTEVFNATLAASLLTILLNAFLVRRAPGWLARLGLVGAARVEAPPVPPDALREHVIICGYGQVGSAIGEALETFRVRFVVVELDPDIVQGLSRRGIPTIYGDATQEAILQAAGIEDAALAVVALAEADAAYGVVRAARHANERVPIVARARSGEEQERLRTAGASEVVQPRLEGAASLIQDVLARLSLPGHSANAYLERFRVAMDMPGRQCPPVPDVLPELQEVTLGSGELADQSLREAAVRERFGVLIVAVRRPDGTNLVNPSPDTVLRPGDRIRLFGLPEQVAAFRAAGEAEGEGAEKVGRAERRAAG